jgi:hypothetical protein
MKMELRNLKSLRKNKGMMIFNADKGSITVVMNRSDYLEKMNILLHSDLYERLKKDPTATTENKIKKILPNYKSAFTPGQKHK